MVFILKKAKEYGKYMMTIQVVDALAFLKTTQLGRLNLICYCLCTTAYGGLYYQLLPAVPLEAMGALRKGLGWKLCFIAGSQASCVPF